MLTAGIGIAILRSFTNVKHLQPVYGPLLVYLRGIRKKTY